MVLQVPGTTDDPQHWRNRAAHMRTLAVAEDNPNTAQLLTDLAADYDELAGAKFGCELTRC